MKLELTQILLSLFLFISVFLLVWSLFRFPVDAEPPIHRRIALAVGAGQRETLFEMPLLAPLMAFFLSAARRLNARGVRRYIRRHLDASGNPNGYSVEEYIAISLACGAILGLLSGVVAVTLLGQFDPLVIFVMALVGFGIPLWVVRDAGNRRLMRISKQLPYTLDLVALTMSAGSTFTEAIEAIIRDRPEDDFNQELRTLQAEVEFGSSRAVALANLAQRIPLDTLRSIVGAVNQAEALGTPLAAILKSQSGMIRMHRSVRAEKLSASANLRILLPSMLILIAAVLVVFGPIILAFVQGKLLL